MTSSITEPEQNMDSQNGHGNTELSLEETIANIKHNIETLSTQLVALQNIQFITQPGPSLNKPDKAQYNTLTKVVKDLDKKLKPVHITQFTEQTQHFQKPTKTYRPKTPETGAQPLTLKNSYEAISSDDCDDTDVSSVREKAPTHSHLPKRKVFKSKHNKAKKVAVMNSSPETTPKKAASNGSNLNENLNENQDSQMEQDTEVEFRFPTRSQRIPPIIIEDKNLSWKRLTKILQENNITKYTGKLNGEHTFNIKTTDTNTHRTLTALLEEHHINFHTYTLPADKHIKVVIRSLPRDTPVTEIQDELIREGFSVVNVVQMSRRRDGEKVLFPLFLVTLHRTDKSRDIYNIQYILNLKVSVQSYRGRRGNVAQCHRCQRFHHAQNSCRHAPRCVKCSGEHDTKECPKPLEDPPKCVLCQGAHTANWTGCPKRPQKAVKSSQPTQEKAQKLYESRVIVNKTYAQATKTQHTDTSNNILGEATDILTELKTLVEEIKSSGIIELLKQLKGQVPIPRLHTTNSTTLNHD